MELTSRCNGVSRLLIHFLLGLSRVQPGTSSSDPEAVHHPVWPTSTATWKTHAEGLAGQLPGHLAPGPSILPLRVPLTSPLTAPWTSHPDGLSEAPEAEPTSTSPSSACMPHMRPTFRPSARTDRHISLLSGHNSCTDYSTEVVRCR